MKSSKTYCFEESRRIKLVFDYACKSSSGRVFGSQINAEIKLQSFLKELSNHMKNISCCYDICALDLLVIC